MPSKSADGPGRECLFLVCFYSVLQTNLSVAASKYICQHCFLSTLTIRSKQPLLVSVTNQLALIFCYVKLKSSSSLYFNTPILPSPCDRKRFFSAGYSTLEYVGCWRESSRLCTHPYFPIPALTCFLIFGKYVSLEKGLMPSLLMFLNFHAHFSSHKVVCMQGTNQNVNY